MAALPKANTETRSLIPLSFRLSGDWGRWHWGLPLPAARAVCEAAPRKLRDLRWERERGPHTGVWTVPAQGPGPSPQERAAGHCAMRWSTDVFPAALAGAALLPAGTRASDGFGLPF